MNALTGFTRKKICVVDRGSNGITLFVVKQSRIGETETTGSIMEVPREAVPDLPDRGVAATALLHGVLSSSRDHRNYASGPPNDLVAERLAGPSI